MDFNHALLQWRFQSLGNMEKGKGLDGWISRNLKYFNVFRTLSEQRKYKRYLNIK